MDNDEIELREVPLFTIGGPYAVNRCIGITQRDLITQGNFGHVDEGFERGELNSLPHDISTLRLDIVGFAGKFSTQEIARALNKPGGRVAPLEAILLFAIRFPHIQRGWFKISQPHGKYLFSPIPEGVILDKDAQNYWKPKIVALGSAVPTGIEDLSMAATLSFNCPFGTGRNLIGPHFNRSWDGDSFCFLRLLV